MKPDYTPVVIEWQDPTSVGGWIWKDKLASEFKKHPVMCYTVGWIVKENEEKIMVAGSIMVGRAQYGELFIIPKSCIISITQLTVPL